MWCWTTPCDDCAGSDPLLSSTFPGLCPPPLPYQLPMFEALPASFTLVAAATLWPRQSFFHRCFVCKDRPQPRCEQTQLWCFSYPGQASNGQAFLELPQDLPLWIELSLSREKILCVLLAFPIEVAARLFFTYISATCVRSPILFWQGF